MELHDRPAPVVAESGDLPEPPRCGRSELAAPEVTDPVLEAYAKDVDRSLLIENLRLTPAQRAVKLVDFMTFLEEIHQAGHRLRRELP
jgi:hypothetical protein